MKRILSTMVLCVGFCGVSVSAEPAVVMDGRVNGLNALAYGALEMTYRLSGASGVMSPEAAQFLSQVIKSDEQMDPVETELLLELTLDRSRLVKVSNSNAPAESVTFGTTFGEARKILRELLLPQKTLDGLLTNGADGWKQVAFLSERSPSDAAAVQKHVKQHLASLWRQSNLDNKYLPLRDFLKQADSDMKTLPEATRKRARAALYQAAVQADADLHDVIPNVFYGWLQ